MRGAMTGKKIGAEIILSAIIAPFIVWIVSSIYTLQARADKVDVEIKRTLSIEEKVDYIYRYLIEKEK